MKGTGRLLDDRRPALAGPASGLQGILSHSRRSHTKNDNQRRTVALPSCHSSRRIDFSQFLCSLAHAWP